MDRNEVIEIAREAGLRFHTSGSPSVAIEFVNGMVSELERAFKLVAAREREACAKVCEERMTGRGAFVGAGDRNTVLSHAAEAIRARGTDGIKG